MSKTVSGTTTEFLYDGVNPVQELSSGTPTANILTGLGIDEYFTRTDAIGTETLLTDALGSTMVLTDTNGTVLTEYTYEPFGRTVFTGAPSDNSIQYTGRENDQTGLYYYRARYYSPTLQRFISEDPLLAPLTPLNVGLCRMTNFTMWLFPPKVRIAGPGTSQFVNPYAYVMNNPLRWTDANGLVPDDWPCATEINKCINATKNIPTSDGGTVGNCIEKKMEQGEYSGRGKRNRTNTLADFVSSAGNCMEKAGLSPEQSPEPCNNVPQKCPK